MTRKGWAGQGSTRRWRQLRAYVLARDNHTCQIRGPGCTSHATHVDHIRPKANGGTDDPTNLRAACEHCNTSRGDGANDSDPAPQPRTRWG